MIPKTFEGFVDWSKGRKLPWAGPNPDNDHEFIQVDHGEPRVGQPEFYRVITYNDQDDFVNTDVYFSDGTHKHTNQKWT